MKNYLLTVLIAGLFSSFSNTLLHAQILSSQAMQKISQAHLIEESLQIKKTAPVIVILNIDYSQRKAITDSEYEIQIAEIAHTQELILNRIENFNSQRIRRYRSLPYLSLFADSETIEELAQLEEVRFIIPDELSKPGLHVSTLQIGADRAWQSGYTGEEKTIVIIDTGIDTENDFFTGRVVEGACFSTNFEDEDYPDTVIHSLCPDGSEEEFGIQAGHKCDTEDVDSSCSHGTHVAGIAAGADVSINLNGEIVELNGVAKGANIYSIQVFSLVEDKEICDSSEPCLRSYASDQVAALDHIYTYHPDPPFTFSSVNMSLGGGEYTEVCDEIENDNGTIERPRKIAIDNLRNQNIPTIAASGNDGWFDAIGAPACISSAVSVGAVKSDDDIAPFSNSADFLDLLAPGHEILSAIGGELIGLKSGTSMAAPHVAGAWALMNQAFPNADVDEILNILKNTGESITDNRNSLTFSRIQLDAALSKDFLAQIASDESQQNEGWRLLSSPTITSYSNLLSSVWTQGPLNSNAPSVPEEESNVMIFDGADYVSVSDLADPIPAGSGVAVYIYEDDNFDQTPNDWPKNLGVSGPPFFGDVIVNELLHPGSSEENVYSLLGNPYNQPIDFDEFLKNSQVGDVVYVYDHSYEIDSGQFPLDENVDEEDPGGAFRAWSSSGAGSLEDGLIAPFQGFFVFATGSSPELTIPQNAINTGASPPFYKEKPPSPVVKLAARINGRNTADTWLNFTNFGTPDRNSFDAPMLYPLDHRPFLTLHSEVDGMAFNIKNLPADFEKPLRIPINLQAWQPGGSENEPGYLPMNGTVELVWPRLDHIPPNWTLTLVDQNTGHIINLMEEESYIFDLDTSSYKINSLPYEMNIRPIQSVTGGHSRFVLNVHPFAVTDPFVEELPQQVHLSQNYPNPFNPATLINYELPETAEVLLDVYSIKGQKVATLVNSTQQAGIHTVGFDGSSLASGVYLYRLVTGNTLQTRKMVLIK